MKALVQPVIRTFFGLSSSIAPKLTAPLAFKLFCTTFKPNEKSKRYQAMISESAELFDQADVHNIRFSGGTVVAYEFVPDEQSASNDNHPTILLVHGWQSHARHMHKFIAPLLKQSYRVIAIDLPGHGQSSGRMFHIPLAVAAMAEVHKTLGNFDMILSHSLGGPVVATTLAGTVKGSTPLSTNKLVMISSPNSMRKIFEDFANMVNLSDKGLQQIETIVQRLSGNTSSDFLVAKQLQSVEADIFLMHAPDDKEVAFAESEAIANSNPTITLKATPGLGHRRIISSEDVVGEAVGFLTQR